MCCTFSQTNPAIQKENIKESESNIPCHPEQRNCRPQASAKTQNDQIYDSVGVLRINWKNSYDQLVAVNYGTAFFISPKLIMTCSHNLFSESLKKLCSEVIFLPGLDKGSIKGARQYKISKPKNFKFSRPNITYSFKPTEEQLAIILLQQQDQAPTHLNIGTELVNSPVLSQPLQIIGYPSQNYREKIDLYRAEPLRTELNGELFRIQNHMIHHTMVTQIGHSGSPILAKNAKGKLQVIGIHTHRGKQPHYNSGLFFTENMLQKIKKYKTELLPSLDPNHQKQDLSFQTSQEAVQTQKETSSFEYFLSKYEFGDFYDRMKDQLINHQIVFSLPQNPQTNENEQASQQYQNSVIDSQLKEMVDLDDFFIQKVQPSQQSAEIDENLKEWLQTAQKQNILNETNQSSYSKSLNNSSLIFGHDLQEQLSIQTHKNDE